MERNSLWKYIQIGTNIRYLQDCNSSYPISKEFGVIDNIERLMGQMEELSLNVTIRASYELKEFNEKLKLIEEDRNLEDNECSELSKILFNTRHTMTAEAQGKFAFVTTDKRYDVAKLLDEIEKIFAPDVYSNLPEMAQFDFAEAGKCIVFERPTSSAFHILRGTEVLVRIYYKKFLRKKPERKTWGQLLNELKNKNKGKKPNLITLNHLVNIKDSFRNPTQHPDKIYDIQEAQDLLSVCLDVVNRMINEMK
jgi:hypothetical protein